MLNLFIESLYGKPPFITTTGDGVIINEYQLLKIENNYWYSRACFSEGSIYKLPATDIKIGTRVNVEIDNVLEFSTMNIVGTYNRDYRNDIVSIIKELELYNNNNLIIEDFNSRSVILRSPFNNEVITKTLEMDIDNFMFLFNSSTENIFDVYKGKEFNYRVLFLDNPVKCFAIETY